MRDALGRGWQGPTIQFDFNLPKRFDLNYVGADGARHKVIMIHRTVMGSMERFVGGLIEHYAGAFPLVACARAGAHHDDHRRSHPLRPRGGDQKLLAAGFRAEGDFRNEKIGYKIREAQRDKIPYMLILGAREAETGEVSLRLREQGDLGSISLEELMKRMRSDIDTKSLTAGSSLIWRHASEDETFTRRPPAPGPTGTSAFRWCGSLTRMDSSSAYSPWRRRWRRPRIRDLDLVEVSPNADPPVCKIMDLGRYKYMQQKKAQEAKKKQRVVEVKEIKLRIKIEEHDYAIKRRHAERFLNDGNKAKVTIMFRGREVTHPDLGRKLLERMANELIEIGTVEQFPNLEGRNMTMVIAPKVDKTTQKGYNAPEEIRQEKPKTSRWTTGN